MGRDYSFIHVIIPRHVSKDFKNCNNPIIDLINATIYIRICFLSCLLLQRSHASLHGDSN